jgi:integrase
MQIIPIYSKADASKVNRYLEQDKKVPARFQPESFLLRGKIGGRDPLGPSVKRRFKTADEAEEHWKALEREYEARKDSAVAIAGVTADMRYDDFLLDVYVPLYLGNADDIKQSTQEAYVALIDRVLIPALGSRRIRELTEKLLVQEVASWKTKRFRWYRPEDRWKLDPRKRRPGEAPPEPGMNVLGEGERRRAMWALKSTLTFACKLKVIRENPGRVINVPRGPIGQPEEKKGQKTANHALDLVVIEKTAMALRRLRDRVLLRFLYIEGCRPHEVVTLRWGEVRNFDTGEIKMILNIARNVSGRKHRVVTTPKNRKTRLIYLFEPLREDLATLYAAAAAGGRVPRESDLVFPNDGPRAKGPYINMNNWSSSVMQKAALRAGVETFNLQRLRATTVALLMGGGTTEFQGRPWTLEETAKQLGHATQTCWNSYYEAIVEAQRRPWQPMEVAVYAARREALASKHELVEEIREMARYVTPHEIAETFNAEGVKPLTRSERWTKHNVRQVMREAGIAEERAEGWSRTRERMSQLGVTHAPSVVAIILNEEGLLTMRRTPWTRGTVTRQLLRWGVTPLPEQAVSLDALRERMVALREQGLDYGEIAAALNEEGFVNARRQPITYPYVQSTLGRIRPDLCARQWNAALAEA